MSVICASLSKEENLTEAALASMTGAGRCLHVMYPRVYACVTVPTCKSRFLRLRQETGGISYCKADKAIMIHRVMMPPLQVAISHSLYNTVRTESQSDTQIHASRVMQGFIKQRFTFIYSLYWPCIRVLYVQSILPQDVECDASRCTM